ncbi:MAG: phosphonate ABC transporter, permease protein PhnE [Proteobacteria bacterium]|nr:phosphonate ABC transporter, permease protein PhnE [Pseudomonadota bacterium]MDA0924532.1 phosphonate ABC transporter, permease protein PhnE [Pseudomonadota bacterium]
MSDATLQHPRPMQVTASDIADLRQRFPDAFGNRRRQATSALLWTVAIGYLLWSLWYFEFDKLFNFNERATRMFSEFFIWGDMSGWDYVGIYQGLAETIAMAFLGTLLGSIAALLIAFFAARNTMPQPIIRHGVRRFLDLLRGIDSLIWALVFVRAVGLGPLAGVLSIFVSDAGTLSKLYSEAIENVDRKQIEGVRASGASPAKSIRFGYLPQIAPVFISLSLYSFESSVRSATILGIVGAGGIGKVLVDRFRAGFFDQVAFVVINILICVFVLDWLSGKVRAHFIGEKPH